jgi:hypothetical protein
VSLKALTHISQVRGGSQARILLADDGRKYVTKLMGNPQCTRVLANDYLACRLARMIGLSVPEPVIILVEKTRSVSRELPSRLQDGRLLPVPGFNLALPWCPARSWTGCQG